MSAEPAGSAPLNVADYFFDRHLREGRGTRVAIAGVGSPLTYAELAERVNRIGSVWRELGVGPGDRILLILPDSAEFIACFFAAAKIGAVAIPVNPFTRAGDYAYYVGDSRPRLAVVHWESFPEALPALQQALTPAQLLTVGGGAPGLRALEELEQAASPKLEAHSTCADDVAFFLYTSGSGGQPKAAMHRHRHMLATTAGFARQVLGIGPDDVAFSASKLFFAYGLGNAMYFPLSAGAATVLLPDRPTPEKILSVLAKHRPTLFFSVPTIYGSLLRAEQGTGEHFASVRMAISAGEALPAEIFERFAQRFGLEILDGIGTTEMLHMFMSNRPGQARPGSCGPLVPGYQARIVDEQGADVPDGELGNLWVQGGSAFAGYWEKPEVTARARQGEWVITGDKFTRDPDGYYRYCGRADDMLKVSGMWVSPMEVENALLAHAAVAEAAVVGQLDSDGLTQIVAYIILSDLRSPAPLTPSEVRGEANGAAEGSASSAPSADELRAHLRQRLPGYKCPREFRFVTELPKTPTGKIQRFKLRS